LGGGAVKFWPAGMTNWREAEVLRLCVHTVEGMAAAAPAAAGGAGGGACPREALFEPPSDKFVTPKYRAPTYIEGNYEEGEEGKLHKRLLIIKDRKKCREYFLKRILIDEEIAAAPDGAYTWILKEIPGCGNHLFALRTVIPQEVGTLHNNLNEYTKGGRNNVIIAGELRIYKDGKGEKQFGFNKLSGSFTKGMMNQDVRMNKILIPTAKSFGLETATVIDDPIINSIANSLILSRNNLPEYMDFCTLENFVERNEASAGPSAAKKQRKDGGGDGAAASGGGGSAYMGGGARRRSAHRKGSRSAHRKSRRSAHYRRRKGRKTLRHGR
jgi:hypothetical protein